MKRQLWIPCSTEEDPEYKMLNAASKIATGKEQTCPHCLAEGLRFYYHEFNINRPIGRGGTLWVWCNQCLHWTYTSGISFSGQINQIKKKDDSVIIQFEKKHRLLDALDSFWDEDNSAT